MWCQLNTHKMVGSSTSGKKGCHAIWKLDLHAPTTVNRTFTRLPPVLSPLQCLHKGTGGSEQQRFKLGACAYGRRAYLQNNQGHPHSSHRCPWVAGKGVTFSQETESQINPGKTQALCCTLNNKSVGQAMPAVSFNGEVRTHKQSQIPGNPLRQNANVQDAGRISKIQVQERPWLQKASNTVICSCCIRAWYSASLTMAWVSQPCHSLTCWSSTGCKTTTRGTSFEAMRYPLDPPSMEARHKV